jgi:hypothetical protein
MQPMAPLNPYQSPRALDGQSEQRPWFALPRVFPKYRFERVAISLPLILGLFLSAGDSLRGLVRLMEFPVDLSGRVVRSFAAPHWDEAAWAGAFLLCIVLALVLYCDGGLPRGTARTAKERWLAMIAIAIGSLPLLLNCLIGERPLHEVYVGDGLALAIGLYLLSGILQIWYWRNRRQASLAAFRLLHFPRCFRSVGQRPYRRPGRP